MTKIIDLFGESTSDSNHVNWRDLLHRQPCPFVKRKCYKTRKSQSEIAIGTCTVEFANGPVMICPLRLLERRQIFTACLHLLSHEPGNELHIVPEIAVPGGNIDYLLVSVRSRKVRDFVGIELQTLDTTGTVWPERQRFLSGKSIDDVKEEDIKSKKTYAMNWKMTAKTTLVQLHHKIQTFEGLNKHLVLVIQDCLLSYMLRNFKFSHLAEARVADSMHFHSYKFSREVYGNSIQLDKRLSTDTNGIATCLGLQNEANLELAVIVERIERKISLSTRLDIAQAPPPIDVDQEL